MLSLLNGLVLPKLKGHTQDICLQASVVVCNSAKTGCDALQAPTQQSYPVPCCDASFQQKWPSAVCQQEPILGQAQRLLG